MTKSKKNKYKINKLIFGGRDYFWQVSFEKDNTKILTIWNDKTGVDSYKEIPNYYTVSKKDVIAILSDPNS